jgi:N-acetylglucosaminyldiphosphoundecaprenol N-acetyl-beta-D-mannosaminyltransferase
MIHDTPGESGRSLPAQLGVRFDTRTLPQIIDGALADAATQTFYVTCNLNHLRVLQSDAAFRDAYQKAAVVTLDSRPMQMISRIRFGENLPLVTGADLFSVLIDQLRPGRDRPMFVASSPEVGTLLCKRLVERGFDPDAVAHESPPFGFERDDGYSVSLCARIREQGVTHFFMGVGAPKSERWVSRHFPELPACHIFCVGAALDFTSGLKSRAPTWLSRLGLEWLHRLLTEPRRLLPRYAGDAVFLMKVIGGKKLAQVT